LTASPNLSIWSVPTASFTDKPEGPQLLPSASAEPSPRRPTRSLEPTILFTVPCQFLGPSRFPQPRPCGMLWSAYYPCRFKGPSAPPDLTLFQHFDFRQMIQAAPPLTRLALSTHISWTHLRSVSISSVETLRRALVCTQPLPVVRTRQYPRLFRLSERPLARATGFDFLAFFRRPYALASGSFHSRVLDPSPSFLIFLSRDSAACSGRHTTPVTIFTLGLTAPPTLHLSARLGAFASGFV